MDLDLDPIILRHKMQAGRRTLNLPIDSIVGLAQQRDIGALLIEVRRLRAQRVEQTA